MILTPKIKSESIFLRVKMKNNYGSGFKNIRGHEVGWSSLIGEGKYLGTYTTSARGLVYGVCIARKKKSFVPVSAASIRFK